MANSFITLEKKVASVLEYLMLGMEIEINGEKWSLCEADNGEIDLGCSRQSITYENGIPVSEKTVYLRSHITLGQFIKLVEKMSNQDWVSIAASLTLRKFKYC